MLQNQLIQLEKERNESIRLAKVIFPAAILVIEVCHSCKRFDQNKMNI